AIPMNRIFREHGLVAVREELGLELLDAGASAAFAVVDHQVAHIYVNDPTKIQQVREILEKMAGVEQVLDETGKAAYHLNHPRAGDLIAIAQPDAWFSYYYWLDDRRAPDFARTVDIHRKPGYDPVELFVDPTIKFLKGKIGWTLLKKGLGFRYLMDVIPLDASLVKGSHGRITNLPGEGPLFITQRVELLDKMSIQAIEVYEMILKHLRPDG
ncbi:MAG: alkaline phosphatase family protein, partial [Nitrospira sp.]|nr:alkaline phosphatase family protein [Nitrospira sp.]